VLLLERLLAQLVVVLELQVQLVPAQQVPRLLELLADRSQQQLQRVHLL
jgi:hypothetical protein